MLKFHFHGELQNTKPAQLIIIHGQLSVTLSLFYLNFREKGQFFLFVNLPISTPLKNRDHQRKPLL